jgi:2-dehydro-3-deoxyphosphooctonate aldolase (KDO 8-P synthase)
MTTLFKTLQYSPFLIAGPCVIESEEICFEIAETAKRAAEKFGFTYIFKASFDKANRTSIKSFRGSGIEAGLKLFEKIKTQLKLPITTDIHLPEQANLVKEVVDIIQIPAFLCRQTDLLIAAAETNKVVNIKKAQFLSGAQMRYPLEKVLSTGNQQVMLTERGSMFGYERLVVDYTGILDMQQFGVPVVMDATHAVQQPGALGGKTSGNRQYALPLAKAAAAIGVRGFFFEVHPNPENALSDAANTLHLSDLEAALSQLQAIISR